MVSVRAAKSKGAQFEYSVHDSLKVLYPDLVLTKQIGFVSQYDLISEEQRIVIECKRHKGFSWNELIKYYYKLKDRVSNDYNCFLIFQANRQPPLVMYKCYQKITKVCTFEDFFRTSFTTHKGDKK